MSDELHDLEWLNKIVPTFYVDGSDVEVLFEPAEFYSKLQDLIKSAKYKIFLSSLYLGTGNLDSLLIASLNEALSNNEDLKIKILLDYTRATRGRENSCTILHPLLKGFRRNVDVFLFHTPLLRGLLKSYLPDRWNEILGVQHMKLYIFDDQLLISGANLSDHYFTHRQDRYILIKNCRNLIDFYEDIIDAVGRCSFFLDENCEKILSDDCFEHPYEGDYKKFCDLLKNRLKSVIDKWREITAPNIQSMKNDTKIFPLLQMGPVGFDTENLTVSRLLAGHSMTGPIKMAIASGYFNLTSAYMDLILKSDLSSFDILMSSPQANGFFNASGLSKFIPPAYIHISKMFFDNVQRLRQSDRISLSEYSKDSWTFHAKGIWITSPNDNRPFATLIGSTNYGHRSVHRDLETQIIMVTKNEALKRQLREEQERLWSHSNIVDVQTFRRPDHFVPFWVRFVTRFVKNFF